MKFDYSNTERGFRFITFEDRYRTGCSIQKSSLASEEAIWFGVDSPKMFIIDENDIGTKVEFKKPDNMSVHSRMHLTQDQVKELLPILNYFAETGELPTEEQFISKVDGGRE